MLPWFHCGISAMQEAKYGPAETSTSSFLEPINVTSCGKKGLCRLDQIKHSETGRLYRCTLNMTIIIIKKKQRDEREGSGTSGAETEVMHPQAKEWGQPCNWKGRKPTALQPLQKEWGPAGTSVLPTAGFRPPDCERRISLCCFTPPSLW